MSFVRKRVNWIDIYKGIAIILMVIGHSTGKFNTVIYQFHMTAFFFISGYTFNIENKSSFKNLFDKFFTLLLPLFTIFFLLLIFVEILDFVGLFELFFSDPLHKVGFVISNFFEWGNNYINWLGAVWFIFVLFSIFIFHKILYFLLGKKISVLYLFVSILFFLYGYKLVEDGKMPHLFMFYLDLLFIGQLYFCVGIFLKKYSVFNMFQNINGLFFLGFSIAVFFLWFFSSVKPTLVNYPTRSFGNPVLDFLAAMNGTFFCVLLAILIDKLPTKITGMFTYLGKHTYGIVVFHFMFFNVIFVLLYMFDVVELSYLKNLVPTPEIGNKYWFAFLLLGTGLSSLFWDVLLRFTVLNKLLGQDKVFLDRVWTKLCGMSSRYKKVFLKNKK